MKRSTKFWISNLAFITAFIIGILFFIRKNNSEDLLIRAEGNRSEIINEKGVDLTDDIETKKTDSDAKNEIINTSEKVVEKYPIYITGEVNNPGIYHVEEDSYVYEVIEMAGGFTEEAAKSYLNLAAKVNRESHIFVPNINDSEIEVLTKFSGITNPGSTNESFNNKLVNINNASLEELKTLPGIGQAMAERIITYRKESGRFKSKDELMNINGIKESKFNKIKDLITT